MNRTGKPPSTVEAPRRDRLAGIDVARGIAVLLMIQTHAYDGWVRDSDRTNLGFKLTRVLGTLPLPMFLLLAGIGFALRAQSDAARGMTVPHTRRSTVQSALRIVLTGYALATAYGIVDGGRSLDTFLRADILHAIGLSLAIVAALGLGSARRLSGVAVGLTFLPVLLCPWLTRMGHEITGPFRYAAGPFIEVPGVTSMPVVPLLSFCALGVLVGGWLQAPNAKATSARKLMQLGALGVLLTVAGVVSSSWAREAGISLSRAHPSVALNVVDLDGRALIAIALSALSVAHLGRARAVLVACGRHSLFIYGLHIPFCYGRLARPIKHGLSLEAASLGVFALALTCAFVALGLTRLQKNGPSRYPSAVKLLFRKPRPETRSYANRVRLLHDGGVALPAMLDAIRCARHEVLLEMYWFGSDRTGRAFADALIERARAGVTVRVIYDALGSIDTSDSMFDAMRSAGCEVFEFNPIAPWRARFSFARINRRDHRKLVVADGSLAITGGINLGDEWAPKHDGGGGFRDDAVEVRGAAATQLRAVFYRTFPALPVPIPEPVRVADVCEVLVLASDVFSQRHDIYSGYLSAIRRSQRDVLITNSYFIPAGRVRRALSRAVKRGVRVRVLVPLENDVKIAQYASRACYERLLAAGVEVYEWSGGILHGKTAAIDDDWCTVGSFNFDALSLHNNLELNVAILSREVTAALRRKVEQDLLLAERVDLAHFRERSLITRLLERFFHALRWLL